jgi:hypothetical protein
VREAIRQDLVTHLVIDLSLAEELRRILMAEFKLSSWPPPNLKV